MSGIVNYSTTSTSDHETKPTRERIAELLAKGLTVRETADLLGITTQNVYKHIHKHGIDHPGRAGRPNRKATP